MNKELWLERKALSSSILYYIFIDSAGENIYNNNLAM